ncbi:MFS transporter [Paenibacillus sp. J22TS3]|uniref:staphylopine family metallophore export MFS transporter CntE n=1 Tax=Paenibacillus sp. J22TS3 TaxID=2807192 RepID=UPI001B28F5AB|nr:MFS transporter [Paenibacillus sp. J22TS3]GIP19747.1 MFS transporter [Paenibacillus sp. J22TS3]
MNQAMSWPFIRLYLLALLYFSANAILNVIIPLQGKAWGASSTSIGLIMGAYMFTTMFFRPWAGRIIQKHGPVKVLRLILITNGIALVLYTITGFSGYLVARILQGVSTAFFSMSLQIGIIDALPEKERSQGISFYSLFTYIPGILGPLLALALWQSGGMSFFTITMITIAIITGMFGYSIKVERTGDLQTAPAEQGAGLLKSYVQLVRNPFLFQCSLLMLTASMVFGATTAFIPVYAISLPQGNAGIYLAIQASVVVIARYTLRKRIPSDAQWCSSLMMGMMLILAFAAGSISYSIHGGAVFLYAGAVLMGAAQAIIYPTLTTFLSFVLPQPDRNVLIGLFIAMADLGVSLGGAVMGPVADLTSYSWMYMFCAFLAGGMTLAAYDRRKWFRGGKQAESLRHPERIH